MTESLPEHFILGGDSLVGRSFSDFLTRSGVRIVRTTRRLDLGADSNILFWELGESMPRIPKPAKLGSPAWILAHMGSMRWCEDHEEEAFAVNVDGVLSSAISLKNAGWCPCLLSSNTVFDGTIDSPEESTTVSPNCVYGKHKAHAEKGILAMGGKVIRISKIWSEDSALLKEWVAALQLGKIVNAFEDLVFCPMSIGVLMAAMTNLAGAESGIWHLSGADNCTYYEVACKLADRVGAPRKLVRAVSCVESMPVYQPRYARLDVMKSSTHFGFQSESILEVLEHCAPSIGHVSN